MPKKPESPTPIADPTSTRIVLAIVERSARNVSAPARHLTAADLARMAYQEGARSGLADGIRPEPRNPDQELAAAIADRLVATGRYTADPGAIAKAIAEGGAPEPADPVDETPATPAATPEV